MALIAAHLELILQIAGKLGEKPRTLSLGYPDALITAEMLSRLLGEKAKNLKPRADSEAILRWHHLEGRLPHVVDTEALFEAAGVACEFIDISPSRGVERQADLNHPLSADFTGRYKLVLDLGTLEHCFNIGQAMVNVANCLEPGGFVLHSHPLAHYNHGFFNFSPTFYADFYGQNGFQLIFLKGLAGSTLEYQVFELDQRWQAQALPVRSQVLVIAQKVKAQDINWPMQGKYRKNPELKG